ncbi:MAG: DNA-binding protein [Stackebrandtia sp.]
MADAADVARTKRQQTDLYGESLGDLFGRVGRQLGLNQARIAKVLGLSAPMLSQLISAQRTKIGDPAAVQRLQALAALTAEAAEQRMTDEQVTARLAEISAQSGALTATTSSHAAVPAAAAARSIQGLLRAIAGADEVLAAAEALDRRHPELARFLRVYGAGRTPDAVEHYTEHEHLI